MAFELLTTEQMGAAERRVIESGRPGFDLMRQAGQGVAAAVNHRYPGRKILVLCGPGNNGGDGFISAGILKKKGHGVRLACLANPATMKGDAAQAVSAWDGEILSFKDLDVTSDEVVVDAVFGSGFRGDLPAAVRALFRQIEAQKNPVVAVDVPSGLNGSTGEVTEGTPKSAISVSFFRKRLGHVLMPGAAFCGEMIVADIGLPDSVLEETGYAALENDPALWRSFIRPKMAGDTKYMHGHAVVYGGPRMTGAACLAAHAALRAGAGLCTIAAAPEAADVYRRYLPNIMYEPCAAPEDFILHTGDERRNAVLIGPGAGLDDGGKGLRLAVRAVCASGKAYVLDADALSAFKNHEGELAESLNDRGILTPHEGEFGRIFPDLAEGVKTERVRAAAQRTGATVLLKGADTVIAAPDGRIVVNAGAPPALATAGSGDVLAGMILGLLARHVPVFEAACAAAWMHGEAARLFGGEGLIATDIIEKIPAVFNELFDRP